MLAAMPTTVPASTKRFRVVVIERQALFGKALCQILAVDPSIEIAVDAESIASAALPRVRPDLILLDVDGVHGELSEAMRTCQEEAPQARVCVLSTHVQAEVMQRCMSVGIDGYIVKDILPADLVRAVKLVAAGQAYVDPRVAGRVLRRRNSTFGRAARTELSIRETEIIRLIAEGLSNKEISAKLHLSEKTVKNHVGRIFAKLNINARTQAAVYAIKTGLA